MKPPVIRSAQAKTLTAEQKLNPWLGNEMAMGGSPGGAIQVAWADESTSPLATYLGDTKSIAVKLNRQAGTKGQVRLKLITTQVIPKKKVKQKNKEVMIDDLDRALRLDADVMIDEKSDQANAVIRTPADLPERVWSVVVAAELVSPKTKKVVYTTYTSARTLTRAHPFSLTLSGEAKADVSLSGKEPVHVTGTIQRKPGFARPVTVTLEGLPKGLTVPSIEVAGDVSEFKLPLQFGDKAKPSELKNIRLVAILTPNPENKTVVLKSIALPLTIKLVK